MNGVLRMIAVGSALAVGLASHAAAQSKVAVASLQQIFSELQETKDIRSRFQGRIQELENQRRQVGEELQRLQRERDDLYRPGSPEFNQRNRELFLRARQAEAGFEFEQSELIRQQKQQSVQLVDKIVTSIGAYAAEQNIQIVFSTIRPQLSEEEFNRLTPEQVAVVLNQRNPLYSSPDLDIGNQIIARMDAAYRANPTPAPAPTPEPLPTPAPTGGGATP
jgi:Skp family chaperone for outer membrane proteins